MQFESNKIKEYIKRIEIIKETIEFCDDNYPNPLDDFFEEVYSKIKMNNMFPKRACFLTFSIRMR